MSRGSFRRSPEFALFIGPENLARTADGIVFGMGEVVDVVNVSPDFRREEFGVERNLFGPRISIQPGKVGERKWLTRWRFACGQLAFISGLRLNHSGGAVLRKQI